MRNLAQYPVTLDELVSFLQAEYDKEINKPYDEIKIGSMNICLLSVAREICEKAILESGTETNVFQYLGKNFNES